MKGLSWSPCYISAMERRWDCCSHIGVIAYTHTVHPKRFRGGALSFEAASGGSQNVAGGETGACIPL